MEVPYHIELRNGNIRVYIGRTEENMETTIIGCISCGV